jgi:hypothetical protein
MKIRVRVPEELCFRQNGTGHRTRHNDLVDTWIDEILLWALGSEMDVSFYSIWRPKDAKWNDKRLWAVFTVETEMSFMFSLRWGALLHKGKKREKLED